MSNSSNSASSGIGLVGLVFIVFLVLKLTEIGVVADWSWWWVLCPLWIPLGIALSLIVVGGGGLLICKIFKIGED